VIEQAIAGLAENRESGATDLAREALDVLQSAGDRFPEEGLGAYLDGIGVLIVLTCPNMASVKNAVSRALADGPFSHPGQAKRAFGRARAWLDYAAKATSEEAASLIPDEATVVTCSYSGTVLEACGAAVRAGKTLRVVALTSLVGGIAYGERIAEKRLSMGVAAEVFPDEVALSSVGPITLALIGADRVRPDGSTVNGSPSLGLAQNVNGIAPLYVACETFKLDDAEEVGEGFEAVPADLIAGYVTDRGVVQPDQIWELRQSP
jgi:translation initiation factor 2B subunit (eIF-2B alpha/beta/delta family)